MTGIYQNIGQALDVSFLICSLEATEKNAERIALIRVLESLPVLTKGQQKWLEQLIGQKSENIDFDGLTALEIRGQAMLVVDAVKNHLHPAEASAIIGSYTRVALEKAEAVRYLSEYLKAAPDSRARLIADYAVLRALPQKKEVKLRSPEEIVRMLGMKSKEAAAYVREMKKKIEPLRLRGESNLDQRFKRDGLITDESYDYA